MHSRKDNTNEDEGDDDDNDADENDEDDEEYSASDGAIERGGEVEIVEMFASNGLNI